jgi:acylphosphatase
MIRAHVFVHGRVQGVWFRESTRIQAEAAGVAGWVRNCSDGTVEAVFEGSEHAVEAIIDWCGHGPPQARIDRVTRRREEPAGLTGFEVRSSPVRAS